MSELSKLGNNLKNNLDRIRKSTIEKWEDSDLLRGLRRFGKLPDNVYVREVLLEKNGHTTKTERDERLGAIGFPMVRTISTTLLANDIVSVQPLAIPTGQLFYFDIVNPNQLTRHVIFEKHIPPRDIFTIFDYDGPRGR